MHTQRQRLLNGVAVVGVRPNNGDVVSSLPVPAHGLAGNPHGFNIKLRKPLRNNTAGYGTVERVKHLRSGAPLVNAGGHLGRRGNA
jgi:hypothetical protein